MHDKPPSTELIQPVSWKQAAAAAIGLSLLFMAVYNATNYLTSLRSDVGTWYYSWERAIPFVPGMIIPYMSIDLFFVAAPFLCRDRRELRILSRRIVVAIVLSGVCFVIYPLTLALPRPYAAGWIGVLFDRFREFDLPYNLCPSLHIASCVIFAEHFARHTRGVARWASNFWFGLIGLSTLLTYQHHFVDIIGGLLLSAVCFYVVRDAPWRLPVRRNHGIGTRYLAAAVLFAAVGFNLRPWGLWLLWPAISSGLVAVGYFGWGPGVYGKHGGRLPFATRLILAPMLFGQYLSWIYYRRQCRAWDTVAPNVWIGRRLTEPEARRAVREGVTAVVDLTVSFSESSAFRNVRYHPVPVIDLTAPINAQLAEAAQFIEEQSRSGIVYVHCKIGYSRSAAVVGVYLLQSGIVKSAAVALQLLRSVRPSIVIRPEAEAAISDFEQSQHAAD